MTKQAGTLIAVLTVFAVLLGYNYVMKPFADLGQSVIEDVAEKIPDFIQLTPEAQTFQSFSTEQKVSQLIAASVLVDEKFVDPVVASESSQVGWVLENNPGVVTIFGSRISQAAAKQAIATIKSTSSPSIEGVESISPWVAVDHEGGTVQRLNGKGFSVLPSWQRLCRQDRVASQISIEESAQELKDVGVDMIFGPVLDIAKSNRWLG